MKLSKVRFTAVILLFAMLVPVLVTGCGMQTDIGAEEDKEVTSENDSDMTNISYKELSEGDAAPDFDAELVDGGRFALSENAGKVILINIWATWCGPCVEEMPAFEKLNNEYSDDVKIVCVNCMEEKSEVNSFVKDNGYTFPVAYDVDGTINMHYPTQGIPYTVVVGKDGTVKNIFLGSNGMEEQYRAYKAAIDEQLAK